MAGKEVSMGQQKELEAGEAEALKPTGELTRCFGSSTLRYQPRMRTVQLYSRTLCPTSANACAGVDCCMGVDSGSGESKSSGSEPDSDCASVSWLEADRRGLNILNKLENDHD